MAKFITIKLSGHACPACGESFPTDHSVDLLAGDRGVDYVCPRCSAPVSIRVDRRGQVRFESDSSKPFTMPDGSPLPTKLVSQASRSGDYRPRLSFALDKYEIRLQMANTSGLKRHVDLPILWTPDSSEARLVRLTDIGVAEATITCRCPKCGSPVTTLKWSGEDDDASPDPPFGVVVVDTYLKPLMRPALYLGQRLREQRLAAALLVCRRCETQTGYVFREPRGLRRVPLDQLLRA